jgi:putative oxidoreductase
MATIASFRRVAAVLCDRLDFAPSLLARLVVGAVFVPSGWAKLHNLGQFTDFFASLGIPFPAVQAPVVAGVELVCGALVLLGLGARLAALPLIGTMLVAIVTAVWPDAEGVVPLLGKIEPMLIALLAGVAIHGPGAVSLDARIGRRRPVGVGLRCSPA